MTNFRKANLSDIDKIEEIYNDIHTGEEQGKSTIGWVRGIYPTRETALASLERDDLFVMEVDENIVGCAIINKIQVPEYVSGNWENDADDNEIMVLHTLVISPKCAGKGYGKSFVKFYETYALKNNCPYLRMDTNQRNTKAYGMYMKLGYRDAGVVPCDFNGIEGISLVILEKKLELEYKILDESFSLQLAEIDEKCMSVPWTEGMFKNELSNEKTCYIGAFINDILVGYGGMWCVLDEAQITNIAVLPQYRKLGIGNKIVEELVKNSPDAQVLTLEVRESNEKAIRLYEKNGFVRDGVRKNYYKNPTEDAILMSKKKVED